MVHGQQVPEDRGSIPDGGWYDASIYSKNRAT